MDTYAKHGLVFVIKRPDKDQPGGSGGRGSGPGFCMDSGGCLVGVRWGCGQVSGRFLIESVPKQKLPKTKETPSPKLGAPHLVLYVIDRVGYLRVGLLKACPRPAQG